MKRFEPLLRVATLAVSLLAGLATHAPAQSLQTGNITGRVTDPSGAALQGVTVTLTSPVLLAAQVATTDAEGGYGFRALPPGTYALAFEHEGFRRLSRTGLLVELARTLTVDAALEVGARTETVEVVGAPPTVDVTQAKVATNIDASALQNIPTARDVWAILQVMAPQVVLDREDVGGSEGGLQAVFSTHGSSWHQNTYALNGVNVTDPAASGAAMFYYDYDSFEQVQISTAQHAAEVGTPGVYFNLVAKRGTDAFHGGLAYYFENDSLVSDNLDQELRDQGLTGGAGIDLFSDATAQLGGPILKDKLRFFTSWRDWRIHRKVPNFPGSEDTDLFSWLFNVNYQLNAKNRIDLLATRQTYWKPNRNASGQVGPDSTWIEDDVMRIYQASYNSQITSSALFDARVSYSNIDFPLKLQPGVTQPNMTETTTGVQTGVAAQSFDQKRSRLAVDTTLSWYKGQFLGANHEAKLGYSFYRGYSRGGVDALDGINLTTFNGQPSTVTEYNTPVASETIFTGSVVYLQDNLTRGRLALNLGLRFEHTNGFLPAQSSPAGPFAPAREFPQQDVISWNDLAPRIGLVYDLTGSHKSALKLGFGRYYHQITSGFIETPGQNTLGGTGYNWIDRNGDRRFQRGEEGAQLFSFGGSVTTVDPELARPRTDEVTAGLEFELPYNVRLSVDGVLRWGSRLIAITEVGIPFDSTGYTSTTAIDPGVDGVAGTSDDRSIGVLNRRPEMGSQSRLLQTNPDDFDTNYKGLEVALQKRFSNRWQGLVSYAYATDDLSRSGVTISGFGGEEEGAGGVGFGAGSAFLDPNQRINNTEGPTFFNRTHLFKANLSYEVPSLDMNFAAAFKVQTGTPFGRIVSLSNDVNGAAFNQGPITIFAEPRDSNRFDTLSLLDLRVSKFFTFKEQHRVEVIVDAFNVFNANTVTNQNVNTGSAFGTPLSILGPRVFRFGARYTF
jgi:hypothetical protein